MRKQLLALVLLISAVTFAQKNEIKEIEKALKSGNFIAAQSAVTNAEGVMTNADAKTKAKYYYLKGKAFLGNGNVVNVKNIKEAKASFDKSNELSKGKYKSETDGLLASMVNSIDNKAREDYKNNKVASAADKFMSVYEINGDLEALSNAANLYTDSQKYDKALDAYLILDEKKFTGERDEIIATDKATGEIKVYATEFDRTLDLKAKTHTNPKTRKTASQRPDILKKIALLYIEKKDNDNALKAIQKAKKENPDDATMLIDEANIYYAQGDTMKFKETLMEASKRDPNNVNLLYNIGVVSSDNGDIETAEMFYKRVLKIEPDNLSANINMAVMFITKSDELNKKKREIDDDAEYDRITDQIKEYRMKGLPYLEKAAELQPNDKDVLTTLFNLYTRLKMMDKRSEVGKKLDQL